MKSKKELIEAAKMSLSPELFETVMNDIDFADLAPVTHIVGLAYSKAEEEALNSVYNGDCDFAVFDHYKKARNLFDAYTKYLEEGIAEEELKRKNDSGS